MIKNRPIIREKDVHKVIVDSMKVCYSNKAGKYPKLKSIYSIVDTHLPGNKDMKYAIVDKYGIINRMGEQELVFKELSSVQVEKLSGYKEWYNPDMRMFEADFGMNIKKTFESIDWKRYLDLWITENCKKDDRLVNAFKSVVIPLHGDTKLMQPLNNHQFWLTNTGTGKTMFNVIAGNIPNADMTDVGLFGGNIDDYKRQQAGILHGNGIVMLDEINTYEKPIVMFLLSYMEQGEVERYLKVPVICRGNKTLILSSNPSTEDMLSSFVEFMSIVCSTEHPKRVGRRIGTYLVGTDYKEVDDTMAYSGLRGPVRRLIEYSMIKYYNKKVWPLFKKSMKWIKTSPTDTVNELNDIASAIPNDMLKNFVSGTALGLQKLKASTLRVFILEHLDELIKNPGYIKLHNGFVAERDDLFDLLFDINRDSLRKTSLAFDSIEPTKACAIAIKNKFPKLSYRTIADIVGVSHQTIRNWNR